MQDIVLFDLDGTLANGDHRVHHVLKHPKYWRTYFHHCDADKIIPHARVIFCAMIAAGFQVWIVSGRSDEVRDKTLQWLDENECLPHNLIMRKEGDCTGDDVLKVSWLKDGTIPKERVLCVFDDRARVVKAWRKAGIPCYQVAEGDF